MEDKEKLSITEKTKHKECAEKECVYEIKVNSNDINGEVEETSRTKLFSEVEYGETVGFIENNYPNTDNNNDQSEESKTPEDFQSPQKLELVTGFLRCLNFLSVSTAMFGLVFSLHNPELHDNLLNHLWISLSGSDGKDFAVNNTVTTVKQFSGCIQLIYIIVASVLIIVDSIATVTFRWKEYGELTHRHTDATSILFHFSKNRWSLRFICALSILSTASLTASKLIVNLWGIDLEKKSGMSIDTSKISSLPRLSHHAITWYLCLMAGCLMSYSIGYLLHCFFNDLPWLDDQYIDAHVDDWGDKWKTQSYEFLEYEGENRPSCLFVFSERFVITSLFVFLISLLCGTLLLMDSNYGSLEFIVSMINLISCCVITLFALINTGLSWFFSSRAVTPLSSVLCLPFVISSGTSHLLEVSRGYHQTQYFFACTFITLMSLFLLVLLIRFILNSFVLKIWQMACLSSCQLLNRNFFLPEGAYKKIVRIFDTMGSFFVLVGLILGIFSLFADQYDLDFKPMGDLKEILVALKDFRNGIEQVQATLEGIYSKLNLEVTCQHIYDALTGGLIAAGILGVIPGGGFLANGGAKATYYGIKIGDSLTKLSKSLALSAKKLWKVGKAIRKVLNVSWTLTKTIHAGSITTVFIKIIMFLPPVIVGIYILFSAFWPKRVLFFHKVQRNKFISGQFQHWMLVLTGLIMALVINTALVDEIMDLFNDNLDPYLHIELVKKLGWRLSIAASTFSIVGAFAFCVSNLVLMVKTGEDHENLTNEEKEWKNILEEKKLVSFDTPFGQKIERKNQIKYKKEVIQAWTWCLPISLCVLACSFAIAANLYPKFDMHREPNGAFAKSLEKVWTKIDPVFGSWSERMNQTKKLGEEECLPYASLHDVLSMNLGGSSSILMNPIYAFYNETDKLIRPVREVLLRTRGQLIADVGDSFAGQAINQTFQDLHLNSEYVGLILLTPRLINLLILLFGSLMASCMVCQMKVIVDPAAIVRAFGNVCMFSVIFVLGSQLAFFNILSGIGVPFYTITIRLGLGFIYDLVADFFMVSIYIGMKNEFFFSIPKKKVTVTYSIDGVSDSGPNVHGQII